MSTSGLYGNPAGTTVVPANDTTSLYGASSNAQVPNANGDLLIPGNLAVDGGNITTTASIATVFNTNATTVSAFGAATALSLGADTGTTSINNNLIVDGTINAAGNITAPGGTFGNITVGVATDNTITTTTGNLNLQSATGNLVIAPATNIEWAENTTRSNRLTFNSTTGTSTGIRVQPPVATGGIATASVNTTNDINNTQFLNVSTNQAAANPLRIQTGRYTAGVLGASGTSLAFIDGSANTYATVNPAGPTDGTDLITKAYFEAHDQNTTYTIDASSTTGGANFNLRGSDASVDTIKFASGAGITVSQTDANTITVTNAGVRSITGTANQVIASSSTGAVTLSLPQDIATTSNPTFAGATLGAIKVGITSDNTIDTTSGNLTIAPATGIITVAAPTTVQYAENNTRTNRFQFQSSNGNSSGVRVLAPNATASAQSTIGAFNSSDNNNGSFINLRAIGGGTDPLRIYTGTYTAGVLGASSGAAFVDNVTTYATVNPSGPTNSLDLITKAYFDSHPTAPGNQLVNGSYTFTLNADGIVTTPSQINTGAAGPLTLQGNTGLGGYGSAILDTNSAKLFATAGIVSTDGTLNLTATQATIDLRASTVHTTWGFNSNGTTSFPHYTFPSADGSANQVLKTNGAGVLSWYTPSDLNTTYTYTAGTATGGANLTLTGSDATTNTIKLTNGGHITAVQTSSTAVTLGSDATSANTASTIVARDASGRFSSGPITIANYTLPTTDGTANQVIKTDGAGNLSFVTPTASVTYNIDASATTGGANFNLTGSDASTDTVKYTSGTGVTVSQTNANEINFAIGQAVGTGDNVQFNGVTTNSITTGTINANGGVSFVNTAPLGGTYATVNPFGPFNGTDLTTVDYVTSVLPTVVTYDYAASSATGGANLNLTGSDASTKTIKLTNSGHITATYTSGTEVTLGSDATTTSTAGVLVARDANANTFANATFTGFSNVAASGSTITLTAASTPVYVVTGSGGQTIQLPNATTLPNGAIFAFNNNQSSGAITVNNNSATLIVSVPSGGYTTVTLLDNSTAAGSWDRHDQAPANVSWSTNTFSYAGSITNATWNGSTIAVNRGGTGQSTYTDGQLLIGNSTGNTLTKSTLTAGTHMVVTNGSGAITLSTDATNANTASTIVARDASGNFSAGTLTANLADASYVLGSLQATPNTGYTFMTPVLNTVSNNNGLDVASSFTTPLGNIGQQQITQYSGDLFAGTNASPSLVFNHANGNSVTGTTVPFTGVASVAPSQVLTNGALGSLNFNGYATSGFTQYATKPQGGGLNSNNAVQIQAIAAENFADGTLTISGATITAVSRVSTAMASVAVTGTKGQLSFTSTTPSVGQAVVVTGTNSGTSTGISAGTYYTVVTNGSTTMTLSATPGGAPITTTAGTTTGLTFTRQFITVTYSAQSNIPFGLNALIAVSGFTNASSGTFMAAGTSSTTSVNIGVPSTGTVTLSGSQSLSLGSVSNAGAGLRVRAYPLATPMNSGNRVELINHNASTATYRADTFTISSAAYGATGTARVTVDSSKVTMALPVAFPVYTAAQANAITGAVGWQISISNSPVNAGKMAYWDTTNARWSYIDTNTAV
jgi:hypothetical protein